ncbi:uncharacterized protein LOC131961092 [Centropristis striata]|uniref:uncharacterized protein LOC131961092 n=1 Tax=Centropristis striata TaxID=184440 RepID=UPI0027E197C3|nr:uncharacterized protein LOC131961092 [Centropristis striata]
MQLDVPRSPAPPVRLFSVCPGAPHAPASQPPRPAPERAGRDGRLTAESSAVAPVLRPQARTHTHIFSKKIKCVPLPHPGRVPRAQLIKAKRITMSSAVATLAVPPRVKAEAGTAGPPRCPPGRPSTVPSGCRATVPPREAATAPRLGPLVVEGLRCETTLSLRWERWAALAAPPWVLRTISRGYRLQFAAVPPRFAGIIHSQARGESARVLQEEILSLLNKRAICVVPPAQCQSGFYSRYFLVPKRGGTGIRPILDLRALNKFLRKYKFRMLTHASLLRLVRQNDWFTSVDLKDAYFHIPIYPPHRKYLRFAFQGICYEYRVLPFGLSLSPRVFVRCTEAAIAPLRRQGIRLATYLDDWLLLAQSEQEARAHTRILMQHLVDLGFVINAEKSVLSPAQEIIFLGLSLDSVSFTARLSAERVRVFRTCLALFRPGKSVRFRLCLRLLGLMASAILVVRLGRLHMREFQLWVASCGLDPVRHGARMVPGCARSLRHWRVPSFLTRGVPMGSVLSRKVVTTDASLTGWGGIHEGRSVRGVWSVGLQRSHINFLELSAVFLSLKHFLPSLMGHHVLVRTDNTTTVAYINRQGGLRSRQLHMLARRLILWSCGRLLSLRATHAPGVLNTGADLLSRGAPVYGEWTLHPEVVEQLWSRYGRAAVDLFASRENAQCALFYSLRGVDAPLGIDALAHAWPRELLYAFPPLALIPPTLSRVREHGHALILVAPHWPAMHWLAEIYRLLCTQPWQLPLRRDLLSQGGGMVFHPHPERLALWAWPLSGSICQLGVSHSESLYDCKWRVFEEWCHSNGHVPLQCPVGVILSFLQDLIDNRKAFSTVKVYLAAIAACHVGFGRLTVGQHPLVCRFMKGARRLLPVSRPLVPPWDLAVVLEGLKGPPFEPLEGADLKHVSLKAVLLLALASAKRVSDIHALSVHPSCTQFFPGDVRMTLRPNPAFVPKVVGSCSPIDLVAFAASSGELRSHALCPVRAVRTYVDRTGGFRRSDQLFVSWASPHRGKPITKQRLSHWVVEAIALAYAGQGLQPPVGLRAHSTRGVATSWALFRGVSVQDICAAASWSSPLTFVRFYMLDVSAPCVASAVLMS